ncbi:MAG TPA: hypothetical protein ENK18_11815 [Deltaproteobacteria bacterium]|nr:hypothetical protein [Deltaproteobacteria bacterium]
MRCLLPLLSLVGCHADAPISTPRARASLTRGPGVVRIATWNIETVGSVGGLEYRAAADVLSRVDADIVAIQEIASSSDEADLSTLASDLGYGWVSFAAPAFGGDRNAVISRYPVTSEAVLTSADLSGDPSADDLTRLLLRVTVDVGGVDLTVLPVHYKSGSSDTDEFRRAVETLRTLQAVRGGPGGATVVLGDFNEELADLPLFPSSFSGYPSGLPASWTLGRDLRLRFQLSGLDNDPFRVFTDPGAVILDALQLDGSEVTREASGRRLDYIVVHPSLRASPTEVYDSSDEGLGGGLPKAGAAPASSASADASDHLLVFADLTLGPATPPATPLGIADLQPGDLWVSEVMPDPSVCSDSDGEWVELENRAGQEVDLSGLHLEDESGHVGLVSAAVIADGARVILGRGGAPCGPAAIATFSSALSLNNAGDTLWVYADGTLIDQTGRWSSSTPGTSLQRDGAGWCDAITPFGSEWATPGAPNDCGG